MRVECNGSPVTTKEIFTRVGKAAIRSICIAAIVGAGFIQKVEAEEPVKFIQRYTQCGRTVGLLDKNPTTALIIEEDESGSKIPRIIGSVLNGCRFEDSAGIDEELEPAVELLEKYAHSDDDKEKLAFVHAPTFKLAIGNLDNGEFARSFGDRKLIVLAPMELSPSVRAALLWHELTHIDQFSKGRYPTTAEQCNLLEIEAYSEETSIWEKMSGEGRKPNISSWLETDENHLLALRLQDEDVLTQWLRNNRLSNCRSIK